MKRHFLTLSILLAVTQLFGQESRFWVNGNGKWADQSHWATVSGGQAGESVPDKAIDVVFDQYSFSGDKNTVTVGADAFVGNLTSENAEFTLSGKKNLTVGGSVNVDDKVNFDKFRGALVLAADGDQTLNIPTELVSDIIIESGNWTLGANLTTEGNIYLKSGSLATAGFEVNCAEFNGNDATASLNIENSTIICDKWNFGSASNLTFDAAGSTIMIKGNFLSNFITDSKLKYNMVHSYYADKELIMAVSTDVTNVTCPSNATEANNAEKAKKKDGKIKVTIGDGSGKYNLIVIKTGVLVNKLVAQVTSTNNYTFEGLEANTYSVGYYTGDINDESSFYGVQVTVEAPDDYVGTIEVTKDADCYGGPIKELSAIVTGGTSDYTYEWKKTGVSGVYSSNPYVTDIESGSRLAVSIKDAAGCRYEGVNGSFGFNYLVGSSRNSYTTGPTKVVATVSSDPSCEGEETGKITINAQGGTGVYQLYTATASAGTPVYSSTTTNVLNNVKSGAYNIVVTDTKGCTSDETPVQVSEIPAPTSDAGDNASSCKGSSFKLSGKATNYSSVEWTTTGSGSFDNKASLTATYNPSSADESLGYVTLTLTVYGNGTCSPVSSDMTLSFVNKPLPTIVTTDGNVCGLSTTLEANASMGGTLVWEKVSGAGTATFDGSNVTVGTAGDYTFKVKEIEPSDAKCEGYSAGTVTLTFFEEPTVNITTADGSVCGVESKTVTATVANQTSMLWTSDGAGTFSSTDVATTTYTPADSDAGKNITLTLTVSNGVCPDASDTYVLTVNKVPTPTNNTVGGDVCGLSSTASAIASLSGSTLTWKSQEGGVTFENPNAASTKMSVTVAGTYNVYVVEEKNGCSEESTIAEVTFYDSPDIEITSGDDAIICADETYDLTSSAINCSGYTWTVDPVGTGSFSPSSTVQNPTFTPDGPGVYTIKVTGTANASVCSNPEATMTLTVNALPTPSIVTLPSKVCGETCSSAKASKSNSSNKLTWMSMESGVTFSSVNGETTNITATSAPEGKTYHIYVVEETAGKCKGETTPIEVTFYSEPSISINEDDAIICDYAGASFSYSATIENCSDVVWSVTGGSGTFTPATGTSTVFMPASGHGSYIIKATGTPNDGVCSAPFDSKTLKVSELPSPTITADEGTSICGTGTTLTGNASQGGSFTWSVESTPDGGSASVSSTGVVSNVTKQGAYKFKLVETNEQGCDGFAVITLNFTFDPVITMATTADAICASEATYQIDGVSAENYASLQWTSSTGGSFSNASALNPVYNISAADIAAGSVDLTLKAMPVSPCADPVTSTITLTINPLPVPTIDGDAAICLNEKATYVTESGMSGYVWAIVGGTGTSTTNSIEVTWTTAGAGSVSVSYTNGNGCTTATPTVYAVTVNELPTIGISETLSSCTNSYATVDANVSGGLAPYTHSWTGDGVAYLDAVDVESPKFECTASGVYNLTYKVVDANGCQNTKSIEINNIQGPSVNAGADKTLCYGTDYVNEDATYSDAYGVSWSTDGDGSFDDENALNATYTPGANDWVNGTVTLTLTAYSSSCGSVTDEVELTLLPEMVAAIGSENPFDIAATTKIEVEVQGVHEAGYDLAFYLVSPDGTEVKLYNHEEDRVSGGRFADNGGTISSLKFTTYAENDLDFSAINAPISGVYTITDINGWTNLYGKNPAEGGWSVKVVDAWPMFEGKLTRASISFTDINRQGLMQTILFDSKTMDEPIVDNAATSFYVPMGLRTSCYGVCDARAIVNVIGGSGVYNSYVWSDPSIVGTDTVDLCAGDFTVTVTDANGCVATGGITVLSPDPILLNATGSDVKCYGGNDGSASVVATQGVGTYSYEWNEDPSLNTSDIDDLTAGTYVVKVTDENLCWSMDTVEISQPASALNIDNIDITASSCTENNGSITFSLSGGVAPYYVTCPTATFVGETASTLAADDYLVHVEDANGCFIDTLVSTKPATIILTITKNNVLCNGGDNGSMSVVAEGGFGGFTYSWTDGVDEISNTTSVENLKAGTYGLLVVDAGGCQAYDYSLVLEEPDKLAVSHAVTKATCETSDGSIELTVNGGVAPYTYLWSNGESTSTVSNLAEGVYSVIVTDANLCEAYDTIKVNNDSELAVTIVGVTDVTNGCNFDGAIDITVTGAHGTTSFSWTNEAGEEVSTSEDPTQLPKGTYFVKVVDEHTCAINEKATVGGIDKFEVKSMIVEDAKCPGSADGSLEPDVTTCGGVGPYTYLWAHDGSTNAKATGLVAGEYSVTVYDANGCESTISETVKEPAHILADFMMSPSGCAVNNGTFEAVNITGGNAPYDVMWFEAVSSTLVYTGNPFSAAGAGNYKAVIVDVNGCFSDTTAVTMVDESNLSVTATINNLECYNDNSGSIALEVTGGSGNYAYDWSNGATESTVTNLAAGDYFVTVTDLTSNCKTANTLTVTQPDAIVPTIVFTQPVQCAGDTEASFYATATGGAGSPFSYTWDNNGKVISNDSIVSGVGEGIYSVVITDAMGCSVTDTVTIVYPDTLKVVASNMGESDCSGATGWAEVTVEGGIAPYSYYWHSAFSRDTMGTDARAINLGVDIYVVEVTDALGCNIVDTVEVNDKGTLEFPINNIIGVTCATICDGSATIGLVYDDNDVYNDDTKLKFMWNNNPLDTLRTSYNLCLGTNRVLVVNPDGCRKLKTFTITDELALRVVNIANYPDLNGDPNCNGALTVTVAGGVGNYSYTWTDVNNNKIDADSSAYETSVYSLCEGLYNLHIEDQNLNGCSVDTTIQIEHRPLKYNVIRKDSTTCYGGDNGALEVVGVGGYYEGYNYEWRSAQWPADSVATTALITNLASGWYTFTISQRQKMVSVTDSVFVYQPSNRLYAQYDPKGSHCYDAIGEIKVLKTEGGNAPFTYSFSNESWTTDTVKVTDNRTDVTKLAVGDYRMHIVDNKGCQFDTIVAIPDLSKFTVSLQYTEPRCYGEASGSINVVASSLNGKNFKYEWTDKPEEKEATVYGLTVGTYQVKVTDDSACVKFETMELSQPAVVTFSVSNTIANSCYNTTDGEIQLSVKGGAGKFNQYSFIDANDPNKYYTDNTKADSTLTLTGVLPTGDYKALAYDVMGCASDTVKLRMYSRTPVIVMNGVKDLELPDCKELKADGTLAMNGRISINASAMRTDQVSSTTIALGQVSSTTVDLATLFFKLDDGKVQEGKIFDQLSSRTYNITVGFGEEMACPESFSYDLGSKNDFAITSSFFYANNKNQKSIYTCPDNELSAFVTASAPFSYKFYANYVEEEDLPDPEERTKADTTRTDSAVAYMSRFRNVRFFADSLSADSAVAEPVNPVEPVEVPRYKLDTIGNVVYAVFGEGSAGKGERAWVDNILPYGVETYYYFNATDGVCMDIDSIKATSMKPTYKLHAKAYMDDVASEDLLVDGVYEVAEGALIVLDANDLKFDFNENIYSEQNWLWTSAPTDGNVGSGIKPMTDFEHNPISVQSYGNIMIKVRDSVNFEITTADQSLTCYYYDSIKVSSISGIKPPQVFTPNGDGAHDTWHIEGLASYDKVTIYVFNRWGGRVWQYSGSGRDYTAHEWDGSNEKNKPVPSGTYYYVIQCSDDVLGGKKITGPVTIIR